MNIAELSQLKSKFVARQVADELVIVPLSSNVAQMNALFTLNETGKFIWENANEGETIESVAELMAENFEIDVQTASRDITLFLTQMDVLKSYKM